MGKADKFTLIGGVLAFLVDILTLGTFAGAVASTEIPISLHIWVALAMFYGWFVVSWVLVRRSFLRHQRLAEERGSLFSSNSYKATRSSRIDAKPWSLERRVLRVVSGIGCVLLPIALLFVFPVIRREIANPQVAVDHPLALIIGLALLVGSIVVLFVLGGLVAYAVQKLMPVVHEEM